MKASVVDIGHSAHEVSEDLQRQQLNFWRLELADAPPLLQLPTDRARSAVSSGCTDSVSVGLPIDLVAKYLDRSGER